MVDEQVCGDIGGIQTIEIRIDWNRDVIFGSAYIDERIHRIWNRDSFHSPNTIGYFLNCLY